MDGSRAYFQLRMSASSPSPPGFPRRRTSEVVALRCSPGQGTGRCRASPRVERHWLSQIRRAPVRRRIDRRLFPERVETLFRGRIVSVVESIRVEGGAEHLDLRLRRRVLCGAHVLEDVGRDECRENRDHDDHDEDFDQGESGPTPMCEGTAPAARNTGANERTSF